jgi:hypothetical protein
LFRLPDQLGEGRFRMIRGITLQQFRVRVHVSYGNAHRRENRTRKFSRGVAGHPSVSCKPRLLRGGGETEMHVVTANLARQ